MNSDSLFISLILYYGPAIVFFAIAIWTVHSYGKKIKELVDISRESHLSQVEMIRLLSEIKQGLQSRNI
jgi:hypothetical protein